MATSSDVDRKLLAAAERLGRALRAGRQQAATRHRLSVLQLQVLEVLADGTPRRVGTLAAELEVTQPTASDAVASLQEKGQVERRRDDADGRASVVALTESGAALAATVAGELAHYVGHRRGDDHAERAVALRVLLGEIGRLQLAGLITVDRSCLTCRHFQPPAGNAPARCLLLRATLHDADLRVDCPEHEAAGPEAAGPGARTGEASDAATARRSRRRT